MVDFPWPVICVCSISVDLVSYGTCGSSGFLQLARQKKMTKNKTLAVWILLITAGNALAQQAPPPANGASEGLEPAEGVQAWTSNLGFEPVGSGDLIYISVTGAPELSRSSRVTADGKLMLPLLRQGVPVVGLTPANIAQAVTVELVKEKILVDPIVAAAVLEYRSRRVSVVGAVRMPSSFQAVGDMRLLAAIARAQGFSPEAGPEVIVSLSNRKDGEQSPLRIPIKALLARQRPNAEHFVARRRGDKRAGGAEAICSRERQNARILSAGGLGWLYNLESPRLVARDAAIFRQARICVPPGGGFRKAR
jgi:protein involved in polysaccharide export with SLBB domain